MTRSVRDGAGRHVDVPADPQRIVSLVPSLTELLFDLGVGHRLIGATRYCVRPEAARGLPSVGGTKKFRFDVIDELSPDLVIGNKEENYVEGIERLARRYPVWVSDVVTIDDALATIDALAGLVGAADVATPMRRRIAADLAALPSHAPLSAAYLIWRNPLHVAAADTFIDAMLSAFGLTNAFASARRYPEIDLEQLRAASPDLLLLSSEPYPFDEGHVQELAAAVEGSTPLLVDGQIFSWYGSRLLHASAYARRLGEQIATRHRGG